jgi:transposase
MVIVLDNVSVHTNREVTEVIEGAGHKIQYLPPYSPDYNPIELTFSVLKYWIKRHYNRLRQRFGRSDFGGFLKAAIRESNCDGWARKHFKHAAGGLYIEQEQLDRVRDELREL